MLLQTIWISPTLIFSAGLYFWRCPEAALLEFSTSYLPETSLRFDNSFVFVLLFTSLAIMRVLQQQILFWRFLPCGGKNGQKNTWAT